MTVHIPLSSNYFLGTNSPTPRVSFFLWGAVTTLALNARRALIVKMEEGMTLIDFRLPFISIHV